MKQHGVTSDTFMFTTFTAFKELLQSNGRYYPSLKRFLPCNTKATNDYSDCTGVAYLCNRFFDVTCCNFLTQQAKVREMPDLKFDNDNYALTELLQFIWRSNMRVKESGSRCSCGCRTSACGSFCRISRSGRWNIKDETIANYCLRVLHWIFRQTQSQLFLTV